MPGSKRVAAFQMSQQQWAHWAQQREADAAKIEKRYKAEARAVRKMLSEVGCDCDPLLVLARVGDSPDTESPKITHTLLCTKGSK